MTEVFGVILAMGLAVLLLSFIIGEFEFEADTDGPDWLNLRVLMAGIVGFGAFGLIADELGTPKAGAWVVAGMGFFVVALGTLSLVIKPLLKQESNSTLSQRTYVGRTGTVTLPIPVLGFGEVTFRDQNGARVTRSATSHDGTSLKQGTPILIVGLARDGVVVSQNPLETE